MEYGYNDFRNYELYHHGILGQKWGQRQGPPYPLDASDHSTREQKAVYQDSIGMVKGSRNEGRYAYTGNPKSKTNKGSEVRTYVKQISQKNFEERKKEITKADRDAYRNEMIRRGSNSDFYKNATDKEIDDDIEKKQRIKKAIIIGAAAVGIGAATYAAYKAGVFDNVYEKLHGEVSDEKRLAKIYENAKKLSSDDIGLVLDKNTVLHRVHGYQDLDLEKVNGPLYASYKPIDVEIYRGFFAKSGADKGKISYDITLGLQNDIIAPSRQKTEQIISDLYKNDKHFYEKIARTQLEFSYGVGGYTKDQLKEVMNYYKNDANDDFRFQKAMWAIVRGDDTAKTIQKAVEKEGFTAMIDFLDAGGYSETPLIFFEGRHDLSTLGSKLIDETASENAISFVREHINELPEALRNRWR